MSGRADLQNVQKGPSKAEEQNVVHKQEMTCDKTVQIANKTNTKAAQKRDKCWKQNLETRYFMNAAVLPEFRPRSPSVSVAAPGMSTASKSLMDQPILIHGLSVPEYQSVYHSVVDPKLVTSTGQPRCYSRELGRRIKQRLWKTLNCPAFTKDEQIHVSEQVHYAEKFSAPTQKSFAPRIDLDISYEPKPMALTPVPDLQRQSSAPAASSTDNKTVKIARKRKGEGARENELPILAPHLEERYILDDAYISKFYPEPASSATSAPGISSADEPVIVQPLMYHGLNVTEFQSVRQSGVDSEHVTSTRQSCCYSMKLGGRIKQRLWETFNCSSLKEEMPINHNKQVYYAENFRAPTQKEFTRINMDINYELKPMVTTLHSDLQQLSSASAAITAYGKTIVKKKKTEARQDEKLPKAEPYVEEHGMVNTVLPPEIHPRPASFTVNASGMNSTCKSQIKQHLIIDDLMVPMYQSVHQLAVDLETYTGQPLCDSMKLGHRIKQRLWKPFNCSSVFKEEQLQSSEQVYDVEKFHTPTQKRFTSEMIVDNHKPRPTNVQKETETMDDTAQSQLVELMSELPSTSASTLSDVQVQIVKKEKIEADQKKELQKLYPNLEERYIVNAAVLPAFRPRPSSVSVTAPGTSSASESLIEHPFMIHGLSVPDYQTVYHSVVDQKLVTSSGEPQRYSMKLGRRIKQRLWKTLNLPSFLEKEQTHSHEQLHCAEKFSAPTQKSLASRINVKISYEPEPTIWTLLSDLQQQSSSSAFSRADDKMVQMRNEIQTEAEQEEQWKLEPHLDERYIVNTVVPPEVRPLSSSFAAASSNESANSESAMKQLLMIHGLSNLKYPSVHQSVVDPEHVASTGQPCCNAMELGRRIKTHLWEPLNCTSMKEEVQHYAEYFSSTTRKSFASQNPLDSSNEFMPVVQIMKNEKIEAAQKKELQKLEPNLEERYIVNAAVLPAFRPRPSSVGVTAPGTSSASESLIEHPLMIHGLSVPDYQTVYHSVVDQKLVTSSGEPQCYSMKLGRRIKQRMWEMLNRPSFLEEEQIHSDEQLRCAEKFSAPTQKSLASRINVKISYKPEPTVWTLFSDLQQKSLVSTITRKEDKMVPIAKKREVETAQEKELRSLEPHLEERYIPNAAVHPEFHPQPASSAAAAPGTTSTCHSLMAQPLMIDDLRVPICQHVHQSAVDPELMTSTGQSGCYSMDLDHRIKQRLWKPLNCSSGIEKKQIHKNEQVHNAEKFSAPTQKCVPSQIYVNILRKTMPIKENRTKDTAWRELVQSRADRPSNSAASLTDVKVQTAKKRKITAAQEEDQCKAEPQLQERYFVLPEHRPRPASFVAAAPERSFDNEGWSRGSNSQPSEQDPIALAHADLN